jgi:hypothetical protein
VPPAPVVDSIVVLDHRDMFMLLPRIGSERTAFATASAVWRLSISSGGAVDGVLMLMKYLFEVLLGHCK